MFCRIWCKVTVWSGLRPAVGGCSAGTGKSVVAMHRAAHLARLSSGGRVFLATFSKTLGSRLADGMNRLLGANSEVRGRVEVLHLHAYALRPPQAPRQLPPESRLRVRRGRR